MNLPSQPWSYAQAAALNHRDELMRFWLAAPVDQLEQLWNGGLGPLTKQLVTKLDSGTNFNVQQRSLRDELNQKLGQIGLTQPFAHQLLIALFLVSPPGLFKVANASAVLPTWLYLSYQELYETPSKQQAVSKSQTVLGSSKPAAVQTLGDFGSVPDPDFGIFPNSLDDLVGNRIQLNRLLGLSNLYYIDPEDREIAQELLSLRRSLAELIKRSPEPSLEAIWATDLGDRYWALVRSGVQNEPLNSIDQALLDESTRMLSSDNGGGFGTPGAINALLVAMMFFKPGSMRVEAAEQKLPGWLLSGYQGVYEQPAVAK